MLPRSRIVIAVALALLGVLACALTVQAGTPVTPTPEASVAPTPPAPVTPAPPGSPEELLENTLRFVDELSSSQSFTQVVTFIAADGKVLEEVQTEMVADFLPPDRLQGKMRVQSYGGALAAEILVVGDHSYVRLSPASQWQPGAESIPTPDPLKRDDVRDLTLVGIETLDTSEVAHLTGVISPTELIEGLGSVKGDIRIDLWIETETGYVLQIKQYGELPISGEFDGTMVFSSTQRIADYNQSITIEEPVTTAGEPVLPEITLMPPFTLPTAKEHLEAGLLALEDDRPGLAIAHFDRAIAQQPALEDAYLHRFIAQLLLGETATSAERSLDDINRLIEEQPERAELYFLRAQAGGPGACIDLAKAVELDPNLADARAEQAACTCGNRLAGADRAAKTVAGLAAAAELDPGVDAYTGILATQCFWNLLRSDEDDHVADALDDLDAYIEEHPDLPGGYLARAEATFVLRNYTITDTIDAWIDVFNFLKLAGCEDGPYLQFDFDRNDLVRPFRRNAWSDMCYAADSAFDDIWDDEIDFSNLGELLAEDKEFRAKWQQLQAVMQEAGAIELERHAAMPWLVDIDDLAFSADGEQIATAPTYLGGPVQLWNLDGSLADTLELDAEVAARAFDAHWNRVAVAGRDKTLRILDRATGDTVATLDAPDGVTGIAFSADGRFLAGGWDSDDQALVQVWDLATTEPLTAPVAFDLPKYGMLDAVAVTADGEKVALALGGDVRVVDTATGELVFEINDSCEEETACLADDATHFLAISADGKLLGTVGRLDRQEARVWELENGRLVTTVEGARSIAFSPDGSLFATGSSDTGVARVWDTRSGELITIVGHRGGTPRSTGSFDVDSLDFGPDGRWLATAAGDGAARIWDARSGAEVQVIYLSAAQHP